MKYILPFLLLVFSNALFAVSENPFVGEWVIDVEESLEASKSSPRYNPDDAEIARKVITRFAKSMTMVVTPDSITHKMGKREEELPYEIKSSTEESTVILGTVNDTEVTLTFTEPAEGLMNVKSSATDDMDYYIWKRQTPAE